VPDLLIGIANPAYVGFKVRRAAKLLPVFICNQHTRLAGHQFGAEIIRMAAEPWHPPALLKDWAQQGTQIGQKAIVPHHQFVELTAGRGILIFKAARLSLGSGAQQGELYVVIDRCQDVSCSGEEPGNCGKSVSQAGCGGRAEDQRRSFFRQAVELLSVGAGVPSCPESIAEGLLNRGSRSARPARCPRGPSLPLGSGQYPSISSHCASDTSGSACHRWDRLARARPLLVHEFHVAE